MKSLKILSYLLLFLPLAAIADDVGSGGPSENGPNATDPDGPTSSSTEQDSSWMDVVLEWFDLDADSEEDSKG